ncbi:MAG: hypothetical protein LBM95_05470 [Lactobacillales bacterium]|jgi:uncharacterized membrane protein|nr:hypothetical protein [Lactobacillales bacterium]
MNLITFFVTIAIIVICSAINIYTNKPYKNIVLQNTFTTEQLKDKEVKYVLNNFRKEIYLVTLLFMVLSLGLLFSVYDSITFMLLFAFIFGFLGVEYYISVKYIGKMAEVKEARGWRTHEKEKVMIDTNISVNKNRKLLSKNWVFLSVGLSFVGILLSFLMNGWGAQTGSILFIGLLDDVLFVWLYLLVKRMPAKVYTSDRYLNQEVIAATRKSWSSFLLWLFLSLGMLPIIIAVSEKLPPLISRMLIIFYPIFIIFAAGISVYQLIHMRKKINTLLRGKELYSYANEDDYWRYDVYINPNDPRVMIPTRQGMNITVNFGNKKGQITMLVTMLLVLGLSFVVIVPMFFYDFANNPFQISVSKEEVILKAPFAREQTIERKEIQSVTWTSSKLKQAEKINGLNSENYNQGLFSVEGKTSYVMLSLRNKNAVRIQTKEKMYYVNTKEEESTKKAYEALKK